MEVQKLIAMAVVSGRVAVVPAIGCERLPERGWQEADMVLSGETNIKKHVLSSVPNIKNVPGISQSKLVY